MFSLFLLKFFGIDIWLNTLSDTPKQYDIVVYSTFSKTDTILNGTITKKLL